MKKSALNRYRKRKNNEILYSLFVICIDKKQKRVYIILIRQEQEPARSKKMMITEVNGLFYVTGLVFSDGSSLFYGPFATKEEAESKIK